MKKKTLKLFILIVLGIISLGFVVYRNGHFAISEGTPQIIATVYAAIASFLWGVVKLRSDKKSYAYLAGVLLYTSIISVMFLTGFIFSPTQFVAVIALFYYSSKILEYIFKK